MESYYNITDNTLDFDNFDLFNDDLDAALSSGSDSESLFRIQTSPSQHSPLQHQSATPQVVPQYFEGSQPSPVQQPSVPQYSMVTEHSTVQQHSTISQPVPQYFDVPQYSTVAPVSQYYEVPQPSPVQQPSVSQYSMVPQYSQISHHSTVSPLKRSSFWIPNTATPFEEQRKTPISADPACYYQPPIQTFETINNVDIKQEMFAKAAALAAQQSGVSRQRNIESYSDDLYIADSDYSVNTSDSDSASGSPSSSQNSSPANNRRFPTRNQRMVENKKRKNTAVFGNLADRETVTLTREELLTFSSEQFEDFANQISQIREISPTESNELKKQRRLIKNRESAQASRQRKKSHVDELERKLNDLSEENFTLKDNVASLTNLNKQMRKEIANIQSMINKIQSNNRPRMVQYTLGA